MKPSTTRLSIITIAGLLLLGGGCSSSRVPVAPVVPVPQKESQQGIVAPSVKKSWSTYTNNTHGFSVDFPSDWKMAEYFGDDGVLQEMAFDPQSVAAQEQVNSLDLAPGRVWMLFGIAATVAGGKPVMIGDGVPAGMLKDVDLGNGSNPWWHNKTDLRYAITAGISLNFAYPNELENDPLFKSQQEHVLASFRLIAKPSLK